MKLHNLCYVWISLGTSIMHVDDTAYEKNYPHKKKIIITIAESIFRIYF